MLTFLFILLLMMHLFFVRLKLILVSLWVEISLWPYSFYSPLFSLNFSVPWENKKKKPESTSHNQKQISLRSRSNINTSSTSLSVGQVKVKVTQPCPVTPWTIYTVHGILQAGILEWIAFNFSRGSPQPRDWTQVSHMASSFFATWATREVQEYWCG